MRRFLAGHEVHTFVEMRWHPQLEKIGHGRDVFDVLRKRAGPESISVAVRLRDNRYVARAARRFGLSFSLGAAMSPNPPIAIGS